MSSALFLEIGCGFKLVFEMLLIPCRTFSIVKVHGYKMHAHNSPPLKHTTHNNPHTFVIRASSSCRLHHPFVLQPSPVSPIQQFSPSFWSISWSTTGTGILRGAWFVKLNIKGVFGSGVFFPVLENNVIFFTIWCLLTSSKTPYAKLWFWLY